MPEKKKKARDRDRERKIISRYNKEKKPNGKNEKGQGTWDRNRQRPLPRKAIGAFDRGTDKS